MPELPINQIICGDNLELMRHWLDNSVDAIVTDIPYGIGFMGKEWDTFKRDYINSGLKSDKTSYDRRKNKTFDHKSLGSPTQIHSPSAIAGQYDLSRNAEYQEWCRIWSKECLRIAKPGAFLLCFGGTRTYHRVTCGLEDAGWQIRDCICWLYGSGFPKSHDISKAIDKAKGAEREIVGHTEPRTDITGGSFHAANPEGANDRCKQLAITAPTTDLAKLWDGYGTALKPAWEPIIVAMNPLDGTFAVNAEKWGVAGLNIDGGRIQSGNRPKIEIHALREDVEYHGNSLCGRKDGSLASSKAVGTTNQGRWPANLILDEEAGKILDEQSGIRIGSASSSLGTGDGEKKGFASFLSKVNTKYIDKGGASRFFYCAKASRKERGKNNNHPTVKPLALMKYLCALLKMPNPNQIILDPFAGSGTTCLACKELGINYIGIEKEQNYCEIARQRLEAIDTGLSVKKQNLGQQTLFPIER